MVARASANSGTSSSERPETARGSASSISSEPNQGTGSIDSVTEQIVLRSLRELSRGRTTIVIAHRLATVMEADTVLVLDGEGRLSQEGPPRELIKRDGFFRELFETQRLTE